MTSAEDRCRGFQEALSARLDGEDPGVGVELLDAHLATCEKCRQFAAYAAVQRRRLRIRAAEPVPDLSERILAAVPEGPAPKPAWRLTRRRTAILLAAAIAAAVSLGYTVGGILGSPHQAASSINLGRSGGVYETNARFPGALVYPTGSQAIHKPSTTLTTTDGRPYNVLSRTRGRVTLLYFGYTHCPDVCPINMELTAQALRDVPSSVRKQVTVVFITTDPDRDTAPVIARWLQKFDTALPPFVGLRGPLTKIHDAERGVDMPLSYAETASRRDGGYRIVHAGYVLLFSRDGIAHMQVDDTETPTEYARTIEDLVK